MTLPASHDKITTTARRGAARFVLLFALMLGALLGAAPDAVFAQGAPLSIDTDSDLYKSNQSKVFYHDGKWWALALLDGVSDWYIWKHDAATNTWTHSLLITTTSSRIPDALLDAGNNRLFMMLSNDSKPDFLRLTYSGGVWSINSGFPLRLSDFLDDGTNRVSMAQAKNGKLWLFRINGTSVQAKSSADNGATWSSVITIKSGLNTSGVTDAAAFTASSENYIGVAYGEKDGASSRFGFIKHKDTDADNVWTDESASLTLSGSAHATNEISLTVDNTNNLFLLTQNIGASSGEANNTLFKRSASTGSWQSFAVNTSAAWFSPAVALHPANNAVHVMGINLTTLQAEYKTCAVGNESSLANAAASILFSTSVNDFVDLTVPSAPNFGAATTLMVCVDNAETADIWFNELGGSGGGGGGTPPVGAVTVGNISLSNSAANANASYTIPLTLGSSGALASGSGTITIQFPNNTHVPSSIATNQVTVNGNNVASVSSNSATREVTITTPIALANDASVSLLFNSGAGLLNPSTTGNHTLQARTSAQTTPGTSPNYTITNATTQVSIANVTPSPNTAGSAAAYTIAFNLGAQGRLFAGTSTMMLTFNNATSVTNGSLSNVTVNGANASATGNSSTRTVTITAPAALTLDNNAALSLVLPSTAITNPNSAGNYTLTVATSVETTPITSNMYAITASSAPPTGEDLPITGSAGGYNKPNQNRPFYHDGTWWTMARKSSDSKWYLWKLSGSSWSAQVALDDRTSTRPDCYMDSPNNKLYVLLASTSSSGTKLSRLSYSGGSFSIDSGFPTTLSNFTFTGEYCLVLTKAKNGELWAFRYRSSKVDAMKSSNDGASWSSIITVKSGIESTGLVDAVTFTSNGSNYVGVAFGENTGSGTIYGFLKHKDGDADGTWSDETGSLPGLGDSDSDDHISLAVSHNNEIYFIVKTHAGGGSSPGIALYKRSTSGNWSAHTVQNGGGWTRPAVVVDETNSHVYVIGTQEGSPEKTQYKRCAIGDENSLANASAVDLMDNGGYNNVSVPRDRVNGTTGLLVCAEDQGGNEIWYALLGLNGSSGGGTGGGGSTTALTVNSVTVNPTTELLNAAYTIGLTLGANGELNDNSDEIVITWPSGTTIPASMATSAVTVNGSEASAVVTTPATRQVAVTIPDDLSNGDAVTLAFLNSAGLMNPSAGSYTLQAHTSVEPTNVISPSYNITAGAGSTPLAVNSVSVTPDTVSRTAQYTINLTLGNLGALAANSGTITITWPNNTTVPASIANTAVTVNGANAASVATNVVNRQATITVPNALANNAAVALIFNASAGLVNPSTAGTYSLQAQTSAQATNIVSPNYNIAAATSTALVVNSVSVAPDTVTRTAQYTISLKLGSLGALAAGSGTITITWPSGTTIPASMLNTAVLVNGASATSVATNSGNRQATVTVPNALVNNANVTLIFETTASIVNPTNAGSYTLQARTSMQTSDITSSNYTLNALPSAPPSGTIGALVHATTDASLDRSGTGKLFHFKNTWWLIAFDSVATDWHLWKYNAGTWTRDVKLDSRAPLRIDAVLDSANSKLYFVTSHEKNTKFSRWLHNGTAWVEDMVAANVTDFGHGKTGHALAMTRAHNGELWLFRLNLGALEAKVSTDNGATWSATIVLKSGIAGGSGMVDGVTFRPNNVAQVGVFYGMTAANGGVDYGFLRHQDGAATNSWTDESASLTFFGVERGDQWISAQATPQGVLYLLTRNSNAAGATDVRNTLYQRTVAGTWQKHKVAVGNRWNSPVVAINASQQRLYLFGVRNYTPNLAEYKSCAFGDEASLETQTATVLLKHDSDNFGDLAGYMQSFYSSTGMMLCGGNVTTNDVWHNLFLNSAPKANTNPNAELIVANETAGQEISAYPNPFNPETTIRFRLHESARVRLRIFDVRGAVVRNLIDRELHAGMFESRWNGKDRNGQTVASGSYFYLLEVNDRVLRGRLEMVK